MNNNQKAIIYEDMKFVRPKSVKEIIDAREKSYHTYIKYYEAQTPNVQIHLPSFEDISKSYFVYKKLNDNYVLQSYIKNITQHELKELLEEKNYIDVLRFVFQDQYGYEKFQYLDQIDDIEFAYKQCLLTQKQFINNIFNIKFSSKNYHKLLMIFFKYPNIFSKAKFDKILSNYFIKNGIDLKHKSRVYNFLDKINFIRLNKIKKVTSKADIVIVNGDYAVAVKIDYEISFIPIVLSKGYGYLAEVIKEIALKNNIRVYDDRNMFVDSFQILKVNREIPEQLWRDYRYYFSRYKGNESDLYDDTDVDQEFNKWMKKVKRNKKWKDLWKKLLT